ncbi:MAG: phage tail tape measure protein [Synergistaceae bacterium]|nr:phage tail tape measure protein [Synergistaceae bacterium]
MSNSHIISFMLHAAIAPDCAAAFSNASKSMAALGERAAALSRTAGDTGRYQALQASIAQNKTALAAMDAQAWKLRGSLKRLPQGKTTKDLAALEAKCAKLRGTIETDSAALGKLKTALSGAGVDMSRLGDEHARLEAQVGKVHGAMERLAGAQGRLADTKARLRLGGLRSEIMSSGATLMALKAPVAVAASFEQAMARVEAVSFGGRAKGEQEAALAAMREQALELGSTTRFTATEAANAQEALARAGMKTGEIVAAMPSVLDMAAAEGMGWARPRRSYRRRCAASDWRRIKRHASRTCWRRPARRATRTSPSWARR